MGVEPKIVGFYPKMDGENKGKPYEQMDDLGGFPLFLETPILVFKDHLLTYQNWYRQAIYFDLKVYIYIYIYI